MAAARHLPVLAAEVVAQLNAKPGTHFIDGTFGGGGHTRALLDATAPDGRVLAIDLDERAIAAARDELPPEKLQPNRLLLVHGNFKNLAEIARNHEFVPSGGCLLDLGVSSQQLDDPAHGFGFQSDRLDGRFDQSATSPTVADRLNTATAAELERILRTYGEEPLARPIAQAVVRERKVRPFTSATALAELISRIYRRRFGRPSRRHPATRVFQALRIAINDELNNLRTALNGAVGVLPAGARIGVISYHSLEDRIVKHFFRAEERGCRCPSDLPVCQCQREPTVKIITRRPVIPTATELAANPRSRSAKLRVALRLAAPPQTKKLKPK